MRQRLAAAATLAVMALLAGPAAARDGDAAGVSLLARTFSGNPHAVALDVTVAWVALDSGLASVAVNDPANPVEVGHVALPSPALDVAVDPLRSLAYVAASDAGLVIVDIGTTASPVVVGRIDAPGAHGVAFSGPVVLVACAGSSPADHGVHVVDATDPAAPVALSFAGLPNGALDVAFANPGLALAGIGSDAAAPKGMWTIDVIVPSSPAPLGFFDTGSPVRGVAHDGSRAWLATGSAFSGALTAVDVSAPAAPALVGRATLGDAARGLALGSGEVFVAGSSLGVVRFDVSLPSAPRRIDQLPTGRDVVGVAADASLVMLAERSSTGSCALRTADAPAPPLRMTLTGSAPYFEMPDVAVAGSVLLALHRGQLEILDPAVPHVLLSSWTHPAADFSRLAATSGLAAIAEGECVLLVDISDPTQPAERGSACVAVGAVADLALDGPTLYVATGRTLDVFDVTDPTMPALVGQLDAGFPLNTVAVDGTLAAVGGADMAGVADVTDPASPALLDAVSVSDQVQDVALGNGTLGAAGLASLVHLVDASTPASLSLMSSVPGGPGFAVAVAGPHVHVAAGDRGFVVLEARDLATPVEIASYDTSSEAVGVAVRPEAVFVATRDSQLWTFSCDACATAACTALASVAGPATACELAGATLDGSGSSMTGCAGGVQYQWLEGGTPISGATGPVYDVPAATPLGLHFFELEITCASDPACRDSASATLDVQGETWAAVDEASLRVNKPFGGSEVVSWSILAGAGDVNVHRDLDPARVTATAIDPTTVWATVPGTSVPMPDAPGLGNCFYIVAYGVGACSGQSVVP